MATFNPNVRNLDEVRQAMQRISRELSALGDVVGPASSTDNAIARYNGTTGKLLQNSGATIDDSGNLAANNFSGTHSGTSSGTNTGDQNLFSTIAVSGQSNVVADATSDTLTLAAGSNVTITTDAATDTITIASTGDVVGPASSTDSTVAVWDGTTGNLLKDSGVVIFTNVTTSDSVQTSSIASPVTASSISTDQNNLSSPSFTRSMTTVITAGANFNITGMVGGVGGFICGLYNKSSFTITLKDESASSTASNRFSFNGTDYAIGPYQSVVLVYDSGSSRWRLWASGFNILPVNKGGTGLATLTSGALLTGNGTGNVSLVGPGTTGQIPISNGTTIAMSTMSGDATLASGGALTIANNAVTDAKLRQSAGLSVIGRSANSTGNVADITAATDFSVLRRNGTSIGFGFVFTGGLFDNCVTDAKIRDSGACSVIGRTNNSTGDPGDISASTNGTILVRRGDQVAFASPMQYSAKSADYTVVATDNASVIDVSASGAARTISLTAAATLAAGFTVTIKKSDSSANTVTIDANSTETIDGALTNVLNAQYSWVKLMCTGSGWTVIACSDWIQSRITAFTSYPTSTQYGDLTSLSVPPGQWDLSLNHEAELNGATVTGPFIVGIGTASGNSGTGLTQGDNENRFIGPTGATQVSTSIPSFRVVVTSATTYYYKYYGTFTGGPPRGNGRLSARRVG